MIFVCRTVGHHLASKPAEEHEERRSSILKIGGGRSWRNLRGCLLLLLLPLLLLLGHFLAFPSPGCRCHVRRKAGRGRGGSISPKGGCGPSDPSRVRSHPCQIYLKGNGHPSHGQSLSRVVLMLFCRESFSLVFDELNRFH